MEKKNGLSSSPEFKTHKKIMVGSRYRYLVGSGSYGVVFSLNLKHAIKSFDIMELEWIREIALTKFLKHPSIISYDQIGIVLDYKFDLEKKKYQTNKVYTAQARMQYYSSALDTLKKFSDSEIFLVLNNIGSALSYAHSKNVLHRDLKEYNILVNYKNNQISEVMLCDFGLGKYSIESDTHPEYEMITISHRPPELELSFNGDLSHIPQENISKEFQPDKTYELLFRYDHRVDVWAYCMTLAFLITGKQFYSYIQENQLNFSKVLQNIYDFRIHLNAFITKYINRDLKHKTYYLRILDIGLSRYEDRPSINELLTEINIYAKENAITTNGVMYEAPNRQKNLQSDVAVNNTNKTNNIDFYYCQKKKYKDLCLACKNLWMPHVAEINFFDIFSEKNIDNRYLYLAFRNLYHAVAIHKNIILTSAKIIVSDSMIYAGCYILTNTILIDDCGNNPVYNNLIEDPGIFQVTLKIINVMKYDIVGHFGFAENLHEKLEKFKEPHQEPMVQSFLQNNLNKVISEQIEPIINSPNKKEVLGIDMDAWLNPI